jgi:hypothetical protein
MKVKIIKSAWSTEGELVAGNELIVNDKTAKLLIAGGYAEEVTAHDNYSGRKRTGNNRRGKTASKANR